MKLFRHVFLLLACVLGVTGLATVTSTTYRAGPYTCTTLPIVLSVQFPFNSASELRVINLGQNGTGIDPGTVLTLNSDYSVSGGGYNASTAMQSGSVTVVSTGAHSVAVNDVIVILRNVPVNQPTAFVSGPLTAAVVEKGFDRASTVSQEISEALSRALRFEEGETLDGTLNRTARSGKLLGFDANGNIEFSTGGSGGGGTTYAAGAGLQLSSNEFSVLPDQSFNSLTVTDAINADLAGNADTATALQTARLINGIPFDGTADITVPAAAGTLTGTTLASNVVSSSLTSVAAGTIGTMAVQNSNGVAITGGTINGATVTGLADGMNPSDAVNLSQLQGVSSGIILRTGVVAATTANITLSAPQTIDGQSVIAGNRILVKNQTAPEENGIYDVAAGAWTRSSDSNTASELLVGYTYFVSGGTVNGASTWSINVAPTVLGTDPVGFVQFSASQSYTAGTGINLAGNVFSIKPAQTGLTLTSSAFNGTIGATTPSSAFFTTQTTTGNSFFSNLVIKANQLNEQATNGNSSVNINYDGYAGGTTQFRDLNVYDGKNSIVATFTGSSKAATFSGQINKLNTAATDSLFLVSQTTTTGANMTSVANNGGIYNYGIENSTGTFRGFTAYDFGIAVPSGRGIGFYVSGSGVVGRFTSSGLNATAIQGTSFLSSGVTNAGYRVTDGTVNGVVYASAGPAMTVGTISNHPISIFVNNAAVGGFTTTGMNDTAIGTTTQSTAKFTAMQANGWINVKAPPYNATGDGVTNDTAAIAAAVAALASSNATLYFPPGTYITDTISITGKTGLSVIGDGMGVTILKGRTATRVLVVSSTTGCTVRGIGFNGNCSSRTAGQQAVTIDASDLLFTQNSIINSGEFAIMIGDNAAVTNVRVIGNYIGNNYADGINIRAVSDFVVADNIVDGSDDDCIAIGYSGSGVASRGVVSGNSVRARTDLGTTWGRGIWVGPSTDILVAGNNVDTIKQTGIYVDKDGTGTRPTRITISGNRVRNSAINSGHGIAVTSTSYVTVDGNVVENQVQGSGIEIADWQYLTVTNNTLTQANDVFGRGIHADEGTSWAAASWDGLVVSGNTIRMLGAATNSCIYLSPDAGYTMNTGSVTGNTGQQVAGGDYITISTARMGTLWKIGNNVALSSNTVTPSASAGIYTVFNNQ